jgi:hypothetical protein
MLYSVSTLHRASTLYPTVTVYCYFLSTYIATGLHSFIPPRVNQKYYFKIVYVFMQNCNVYIYVQA